MSRTVFVVVCLSLLVTARAVGQSVDARDGATTSGATVARSPDGRLLVVAIETPTPVVVDGALDEDVWRRAAPIGGFVQSEPQDGQPATERTEVRLAYEGMMLYPMIDRRATVEERQQVFSSMNPSA